MTDDQEDEMGYDEVGQMIEADAENYPNEEPCRVLPRKILGGEH